MLRSSGQGEAVAAWAAWALLSLLVVVTYTRVPTSQLYSVSQGGVAGGLRRAFMLSNFPAFLVAIALVLIAVDVLPRWGRWAGAAAIVLCVVGVWPGVVDQSDLTHVRPVNALPAAGVAIAAALTVAAVSRAGASFVPRLPGDLARLAVAGVVLLLSLPWIAADLGTYLPGHFFFTSTIVTEGKETLAAVHIGHHHGFDGALLVLTALLLSRVRPAGRRLRVALPAYLAAVFAYGAVNAAEDVWHEQVAKRGWVAWRIPDAKEPSLSPVWLVILALAAVVYLVLARERSADASAPA